jgi:lysophospholipase L1-like esterase
LSSAIGSAGTHGQLHCHRSSVTIASLLRLTAQSLLHSTHLLPSSVTPLIPLLQSSPNRTFKFTARYAAAVRSLASQLQVPLLDVWKTFTEQQGWRDLLRPDGLHLSLAGQAAVFDALMKAVEKNIPSVRWVSL